MNSQSEIAIIREYAVRPKKSLGQSFLIDRKIAEKIASAVVEIEDRTVVEIGAGTGSLTRSLLGSGIRVLAVELDRSLCELLADRFSHDEKLEVIEDDFLNVNLGKIAKEEDLDSLVIVGNVPYSITSPLLAKLVNDRAVVRNALLMVQKEVAQRLIASPGTRDYGALTVGTGLYAETKALFGVKRTSFFPTPEVDSTVVELHIEKAPRVSLADEKIFELVKTAAFQQRRKMLRSSICSIPGIDKTMVETIQNLSGVDLSRRGETLAIPEMAALADSIAGLI